ncbi:T6SS immunity protein Tdi1 domain-containing protein [uncultured Lacinutrix sp.]|uniref:T6SS immunity protein Tdi1 domain-containing protein n=1 Tax=uncultured Lacinutrix sp. TaxID=574032 RepID=UPI00262076C9|nr:T6SS immunity protein Tdi1 domain-containing protein [uncultured Lacinutrix sp.]
MIIDAIKESWSWTNQIPKRIIDINDFGNIIFLSEEGWICRICPEELEFSVISSDLTEYEILKKDKDFVEDWEMKTLVDFSKDYLGELKEEEKFCLKLAGVLGGKYEAENLGKISFLELISFSGDLARQIKDLPDGAKFELKVED